MSSASPGSETFDAVILDTDVYSYMHKPGDRRGEIYRSRVEGKRCFLTFVSYGELLFGAYKGNWGRAKLDALRSSLSAFGIVPYDSGVCGTYADLKFRMQARGKTLENNDLWIAACAVRHSIPLVTNNRSHFEAVPGLVVVSESV